MLMMDVETGEVQDTHLPASRLGESWFRVPTELLRSATSAAGHGGGKVDLAGKSAIAKWAAARRRGLNKRRAQDARAARRNRR